MAHLLHFNHKPSASALRGLPSTQVELDWFGATLPQALRYTLGVYEDILLFRGSIERATESHEPADLNAARNAFQEGLWQADVVELFLGEVGKESYTEINLAPNGAWWAAEFPGYRDTSGCTELPELAPSILSESTAEQGWDFHIELSVKKMALDISKLQVNVCAIFGKNTRQYLTQTPRTRLGAHGTKPDFHLAALRVSPLLIPTMLSAP